MPKRKFENFLQLETFIKKDNAEILNTDISDIIYYSYIIKIKCSCGNIYDKKLSQIVITGAFCHTCSVKRGVDKIKKKMIEKYGVENVSKSEYIKQKKKETLNKNYDTPEKKKEIMNKLKETLLKKYGVENASQLNEIKQKKIETFKKNYGTEHYFKTEEFKERTKNHLINKYGYEYVSQIPEIQEKVMKNSYRTKTIVDDNNNKRIFQGYEELAFNEIKNNYDLNDIITDRLTITRIDYTFENKNLHYFCDIYIKSINKFIEVKSTWTIKKKKEKNIQKAKATIEKGYDYEFWIYDSKKNKTVINKKYLLENNYNIDMFLK